MELKSYMYQNMKNDIYMGKNDIYTKNDIYISLKNIKPQHGIICQNHSGTTIVYVLKDI